MTQNLSTFGIGAGGSVRCTRKVPPCELLLGFGGSECVDPRDRNERELLAPTSSARGRLSSGQRTHAAPREREQVDQATSEATEWHWLYACPSADKTQHRSPPQTVSKMEQRPKCPVTACASTPSPQLSQTLDQARRDVVVLSGWKEKAVQEQSNAGLHHAAEYPCSCSTDDGIRIRLALRHDAPFRKMLRILIIEPSLDQDALGSADQPPQPILRSPRSTYPASQTGCRSLPAQTSCESAGDEARWRSRAR